jgi:hypothetical protein
MKPLVLPIRIESESNVREHWSKKNRRANGSPKKGILGQRQLTRFMCQSHFDKPSTPCTIKLTRIAPRKLDQGNIAAAFKHVQDGCADWLGIDDRRDDLVKYEYLQEQKSKTYGLRIEIVEVNQ